MRSLSAEVWFRLMVLVYAGQYLFVRLSQQGRPWRVLAGPVVVAHLKNFNPACIAFGCVIKFGTRQILVHC